MERHGLERVRVRLCPCSMYGDDNDNARNKDNLLNKSATALMRAYGLALPADVLNADGKTSGVHGNVFIGRCYDNEMAGCCLGTCQFGG